jgi:F-type H+-transporting ATPase subunit b
MAAEVKTEVHAPNVERAATIDAATAGQHTASTETAAVSSGLPQFQFQHWPGQIAYLLILFAILYVLMSRVFAPRIRRVFDERERTIAEALSSARSVQAAAEAEAIASSQSLADARTVAHKTAADAKAKAAAEAQARRATLDTELDAKLAAADARIRTARDLSMASVSDVAASTVHAIVEKLTGVPASEDEVSAALAQQGGV